MLCLTRSGMAFHILDPEYESDLQNRTVQYWVLGHTVSFLRLIIVVFDKHLMSK